MVVQGAVDDVLPPAVVAGLVVVVLPFFFVHPGFVVAELVLVQEVVQQAIRGYSFDIHKVMIVRYARLHD